jgi:hypothetical protein
LPGRRWFRNPINWNQQSTGGFSHGLQRSFISGVYFSDSHFFKRSFRAVNFNQNKIQWMVYGGVVPVGEKGSKKKS